MNVSIKERIEQKAGVIHSIHPVAEQGGDSHRLLCENVRRHLYPQAGKLTPLPRVVGAGSDRDANVQVTTTYHYPDLY